MTDGGDAVSAENPFSTRHVGAGKLAFCFRPGENVTRLVHQLADLGHWGQIVGPHGSGKSTLLTALAGELERRGNPVARFDLHDGQRRLPRRWWTRVPKRHKPLVLVDGYEQLGRCYRALVKWRCRRNDWGLLVTSHVPAGLPTLYRTDVSATLARQLVHELQGGAEGPIIDAEVDQALVAHHGNLREVLFNLYDLYEQRRRSPEG